MSRDISNVSDESERESSALDQQLIRVVEEDGSKFAIRMVLSTALSQRRRSAKG